MLEPSLYGTWAGKQTAKGTEQTTAAKRFIQPAGDFGLSRDDGVEPWSDLSKYGARTKWINSLVGQGTPAFEATPGELGWLLWAMHGAETFVAGTDNVQTLTMTGTPTGGAVDMVFYDGVQRIVVAGVTFNSAASALDTLFEAALAAAGYGATQVVCAGGPWPGTPITVTFNGTQTSKRPWPLLTFQNSSLTGGTAPVAAAAQTTPGVRAKHTFVPQSTQGFWLTFMRRLGSQVVQRHSLIDCLVGGLTLEGSTATKALRMTPNLLSLDPFKVLAADPVLGLPFGIDRVPFLYNESAGAFVINDTVINAQSEFTFVINEDRSPVYADDVTPFDLVVGQPTSTISVTLYFDSVTSARWNEMVYGTAAPTAGTKPNRFLPSNGSYTADFKQRDGLGNLTGNECKLAVPSVAWALPDSPAPNPAGGASQVTLAGTMEPPGVGQPYTLDVWNADAVYS